MKLWRRMVGLIAVAVLVMGLFPRSARAEEETSGNIVINGVDIGYADGDYFTKDGTACGSCHGRDTCVSNPNDCNCMRYWPGKTELSIDLRAVQCYGFANYCLWMVYGSYNDVTDITGDIKASSCTESKIKAALNGCAPATHIRVGTGSGTHSLVVISTSDEGITIAECNVDAACGIRVISYTWADFAVYLKGKKGITYAKECNYGIDAESRSSLPFIAHTLSGSSVKAYSSVGGSSCGYIDPEDICTVEAVYTNGWCRVRCPWRLDGVDYERTVFVNLAQFMDADYTPITAVAAGELTASRRSDGDEVMLDMDGSVCAAAAGSGVIISGAAGEYKQIIFPTAAGSYACGWVKGYTLQYDANGGSGAPVVQITAEETLNLSVDEPVYDGYRFLGWAETPDAQEPLYQTGDAVSLTSDTTLYAVWLSTHEHIGQKPVRENETVPTCTEAGGYDLVVYCGQCRLELSRSHETLGVLEHSYENGICTGCGESQPAFLLGDVNEDGEVDVLDANLVVGFFNGTAELSKCQLCAADVNGDGEVDILDANRIVGYFNGTVDSFWTEGT